MANISFFYPKQMQGYALGMNAGLGNLGVSTVQFLVPAVVTAGVFGSLAGSPQAGTGEPGLFLQNAGFLWIPLLVASALAAWFGMNDLASARSSFNEQASIFKRKHNWLMCWLYVGTFGSFIGFSAGFRCWSRPSSRTSTRWTTRSSGHWSGALARPLGGWLADRIGGAMLTFWVFLLLIAGVVLKIYFLPHAGSAGSFPGFLAATIAMFIITGIGNGSTFRMIPVIFRSFHQRLAAGEDDAGKLASQRQAGIESAAVVGFSSAIGAYGGFFIPKSYGSSIAITGGAGGRVLWLSGFLSELPRDHMVVVPATRGGSAVLNSAPARTMRKRFRR